LAKPRECPPKAEVTGSNPVGCASGDDRNGYRTPFLEGYLAADLATRQLMVKRLYKA
jgi:hypothetical protein